MGERTTFLTNRPRQVVQQLPNQRARDIPLLRLTEFPGNSKETALATVPNLQTYLSPVLLKLRDYTSDTGAAISLGQITAAWSIAAAYNCACA